jgi:hypothetical protein
MYVISRGKAFAQFAFTIMTFLKNVYFQGNFEGSVELKVNRAVANDLTELRKTTTQVKNVLARMSNYLEKVEGNASCQEQWGFIFDRIDAIFFIGFQILNVFALLYVYIASI